MIADTRIQCHVKLVRLSRPMLDIAILVSALFLYVYLQDLSNRHQPQNKTRVSEALKKSVNAQQKKETVDISEQHHPEETKLWEGFEVWINNHSGSSGSCHFDLKEQSGLHDFSMRCISNSTDKKAKRTAVASLNLEQILSIKKTVTTTEKTVDKTRRKDRNQPAANTPTPVISGWINTPSGQKNFDPKNQRWIN